MYMYTFVFILLMHVCICVECVALIILTYVLRLWNSLQDNSYKHMLMTMVVVLMGT